MSDVDHTTETPLKRCSVCKSYKPTTTQYFRVRNKTTGILENRCLECEHIRQRDQKRRSRTEHPEREKAAKQRYYDQHGEQVRKSVQRYRREHPDRVSESKKRHYQSNKEQYRAQGENYRARRLGFPNTFTDTDWQRCLNYFNGCCAVCGRPRGLWHTLAKDHWVSLNDPRSDNPGTVPGNIVPLCHSSNTGAGGCNNSKKDKDAQAWLVGKFGKRKAAIVLKRVDDYFKWLKNQGG